MATVTPNFNWPVPTSTDLVKDGAVAIEALGDSIDASLVDLKGGTSGQVLAKASNTDMDFAWVAQDDSNAIQNSIVDAKGDLIAATANDTPARLAVGNNGETLVADSSTSTGLRYQGSQAAGKNAVINGAFDIWQRGTSAAIGAGSYVAADRWYTFRGAAGSTFSRQTASLTGFQYSGRIARDSGNTSTVTVSVGQSIESVNSIPFAGQTVVFSFWAKAGANFSATSNIMRFRFLSSTTPDTNIVLIGGTTIVDQNVTLTTSWQRFSFSATVGSNAVTLGNIFSYDPTGTAGAADNFEVTGVQLELGSVATTFQRAGGTIQGELAACQRYYWRNTTGANYGYFTTGYADSTTTSRFYIQFPVTMRTIPSALDYSSGIMIEATPGAGLTPSTITLISGTVGNSGTAVSANFASGLTQYRPYALLANNTPTAYLGFSAEL